MTISETNLAVPAADLDPTYMENSSCKDANGETKDPAMSDGMHHDKHILPRVQTEYVTNYVNTDLSLQSGWRTRAWRSRSKSQE